MASSAENTEPADVIRVLLVDDNEDDRRWVLHLLAALTLHPCSATETECLQEADEVLRQRGADLIIADWELPDGAGVELAQHPCVLAQRIPVIVVTGSERPDLGVSALGLGAADFLPKDALTDAGLSRACAHALARSKLERTLAAAREAELAAAHGEREARLAAESALREERTARARIASLHELSTALGDLVDLDEIATVVVDKLHLFDHATALGVLRVHERALHLVRERGFEPTLVERWKQLPLSLSSPLTRAVATGQSVRVQDAHELLTQMPALAEHAQQIAGDSSWLGLPLLSQGEVLGVLGIRFKVGHLPTLGSEAYVDTLAQTIAQAMARARTYEQLRVAAELEERMLAVVGHDLRTPLSALGYAVEVLKLSDMNPGLIGRMERSIKRMTELVQDVLNRAALRRGQAAVVGSVAPVDLEGLVRDQVEELRAALPQGAIGLEIHGPVNLPCEPTRTSQILSNLVRNAVQHGDAGVPVLVRLRADGVVGELSVHNTGAPIPKAELSALFDPFKRGNGAGGKGTGLGLFIVHESVTALGGSVDVVSDAGGTVFTARLPAYSAPPGSDVGST